MAVQQRQQDSAIDEIERLLASEGGVADDLRG